MSAKLLLRIGVAAALLLCIGGAWLRFSGGGASGAGKAEAAVPHAVTPGPTPSFPAYRIPEDQLSRWMQAANDAERTVIADGVLTFEEYSNAVAGTVACMEQAGINVVHSRGYGRSDGIEPGPRLSSLGIYSYFGAITTYSTERPTGSFRTIDECKAHSAQLEFLWAQHMAPTEAEMQAMRNHMAACLTAAGAAVPASPSDAGLRSLRGTAPIDDGTYRRCQFEAADAFETDELPG